MCLYPKIIRNRKYISNKKNRGIVPVAEDARVLWVPVGCGKCIECKNQKAREWKVRLQEEVRNDKTGQFVTLTFSNESIAELDGVIEEIANEDTGEVAILEGYERDNEIAKIGVRRFLERWRKRTGKSVKHWLITEIGGNGTENIHLHGIIWTEEKKAIESTWKYGYVFVGNEVSNKTVNYITKYVTKTDIKHKEFKGKILTSSGIGQGYIERPDAKLNKYKDEGETRETYTTRQGEKIALPIYYRNKIYTEKEKEALWLQKLDKQERYVLGKKIDVSGGDEKYYKALDVARAKNKRLGYGDDEINWEQKKYERERRNMLRKQRIEGRPPRIANCDTRPRGGEMGSNKKINGKGKGKAGCKKNDASGGPKAGRKIPKK